MTRSPGEQLGSKPAALRMFLKTVECSVFLLLFAFKVCTATTDIDEIIREALRWPDFIVASPVSEALLFAG